MATLSPLSADRSREQQNQASLTPQWPFNPECFDPVLDYQNDVASAFQEVEKSLLAPSTSMRTLFTAENYAGVQELALDDKETRTLLASRGQNNEHLKLKIFAISRLLSTGSIPPAAHGGHGRLQISKETFRLLLYTFNVPVAFITALARPYRVCGTGFRHLSPRAWDYWCMIPVRAIVPCRIQAQDHTRSTAGSNQMDPFHYVHLPGAKADIRGSSIGLFIRHDYDTGHTSIICFNLLDSRLRNLIEEPTHRARYAIRSWSDMGLAINPRFIHAIYLSSALRWWNNVLLCFNQQLVMHEKQLQQEIAAETSAFSNESKDMNTSLHIMAAHLHRYKSELHRVETILSDLASCKFSTNTPDENTLWETSDNQGSFNIEQLVSQLSSILSFSSELERKLQNILTLLFNQIQATNDRTMQAILTATQEDNKLSQTMAIESHELTRSMKKDSVAMKTIAVATLLFLPGTSFAAIFAMPFFTDTQALKTPTQVWIWAVLSVITTSLAFAIFYHVNNRPARVIHTDNGTKQGEESGSGGGIELSNLPPAAVSP
ncbi:hypothetical protein F5Y09DRAFT_307788 [Xylaria sp. FL1042]|nr:hypothetical protein F5Y09DRAFT_307788 [Xylaria sp. FL1042]